MSETTEETRNETEQTPAPEEAVEAAAEEEQQQADPASDADDSGEADDDDLDDSLGVEVTEVSDVERRLDVEVPWEEVQVKVDEAYKGLSKGLTIKGFRKGKVPKRMVQQLFGKHIKREVVQLLVQESIERAVHRADIKVVGEPKLDLPEEGITDNEPFKYSATFEIVPVITVKDYFGLEVTAPKNPVSDEDVQAALEAKQRELTDYRSVDGRPSQAGDVLLIDILGKLGDEPLDLQGRTVDLSEDANDILPGLKDKLTGIPADQEEVDVELEIPGMEDQPAQKARLLVTIQDVKEKVVPAIDDDLAKDTGEAETLEELRGVLRKKLEEEEEGRAKEAAKKQLVRQIIEGNDVPVAPALVERYVEQRLQLQRLMSGRQADQASPEDEALKEMLRPEGVEVVQSGLVLEAISKQEEIEVSEEELNAELERLAGERDVNVARIKSEYDKEGRLESLERRLVEDKTLDLLVSKSQIIIEEKSEDTPADQPEETEAEQE